MTEHKSLVEALIAFQGEDLKLRKDATNPHFKNRYISLDALTTAVTPALCKHGLVWRAFPDHGDDVGGCPMLRYELAHTSGDYVGGRMPLLLARNDSQGLGSALTYARRYAMCAVLNLVADEDDDGNATRRAESVPKPRNSLDHPALTAKEVQRRMGAEDSQGAPKPRAVPKEPELSAKEIQGLRKLYKASGWTADDLRMHLTAVGVQDVSSLTEATRNLTLDQAQNLNVELFKAVTKATEEAA